MKRINLLIILLLVPSVALAGSISLTTTISTDVFSEYKGQIQIKLSNSGDEAAYSVQLSLISDYFDSDPFYVGNLEPNEPFETNMNLSFKKEGLTGNYPVVLLTEYTDANGYPFSAVSPVSISYKTPSVSLVSGTLSEISLSGKETKTITLNLRNIDDASHDVKVKLILPRELKVDEDEKSVSINEKEEKELNFRMSNFAGLEGSSYVVLASIEYENDVYYSSFVRGMIEIVEKKSVAKPPRWFFIISISFLLITFVLYQLINKKISIKLVR